MSVVNRGSQISSENRHSNLISTSQSKINPFKISVHAKKKHYFPIHFVLGAINPVSYTHLRAHETPEHLVCRLLLEKKKTKHINNIIHELQLQKEKRKYTHNTIN